MLIVDDIKQGTQEWHDLKCGVPSTSCFRQIATTKGEPSKSAKKYMYKLAVERITGKKVDCWQSLSMAAGIEREEQSRKLYEMLQDVTVRQVAVCYRDSNKKYLCSPDGLVGEDGGFEVKNPDPHTHVEYLLADKLPATYFQQVQGSLLITRRDWWDFMSCYPGMKPLIVRVYPDLKFHQKLEGVLDDFCGELDKLVDRLNG